MRESLTKRTLKGATWIGSASFARLGLRVISVAVLARLLTPHEYGVVAGALVAMELATMVYTVGLTPTLIQRREVRPDHVATAFSSSLFMAALAGAAMWYAAPFLADLMRIPELEQILKILAFLTPFGAFNTLCEALLARSMKAKSVALRPLFSFTVAAFLVAIPLASLGFGYWSLVAMQAAEMIVGSAAFAFTARKLLVWPTWSHRAFRELWPMSLGFSLNQPFVYLASNADRFLIGRLMSVEALGVYTRASFVTTAAANLFGNIARLSMFPALAQVQEDVERLRSAVLKSLSLVAFVALPMSAFCVVFAGEIVDVLLGPRWDAAVAPFAILSAALYVKFGWRTCFALFQGVGRPYLLMVLQILSGMTLVIGVVLTAPRGLPAVCVSVLVTSVVVFLLFVAAVCKVFGLEWRAVVRIHVAPLVLTALVGASCYGEERLLVDAPDILILAVGSLTVGLLALAALAYTRAFSGLVDKPHAPMPASLLNAIRVRL